MGHLQVTAPPDEGLKEARGFHHLPLAFLDLSFLDVDDDIAMTFDAGHMVHVDVDVFHLATSEYPRKMRN